MSPLPPLYGKLDCQVHENYCQVLPVLLLCSYIISYQFGSSILPVMQRAFGNGGLKPFQCLAGKLVQGFPIYAAGVWLEPQYIWKIKRVVIAPFICDAKLFI